MTWSPEGRSLVSPLCKGRRDNGQNDRLHTAHDAVAGEDGKLELGRRMTGSPECNQTTLH